MSSSKEECYAVKGNAPSIIQIAEKVGRKKNKNSHRRLQLLKKKRKIRKRERCIRKFNDSKSSKELSRFIMAKNNYKTSNESPSSSGSADWYWENYNKGIEWQNHNNLEYWKSRTLALEHENKILYKCIENLTNGKQEVQRAQTRTPFGMSLPSQGIHPGGGCKQQFQSTPGHAEDSHIEEVNEYFEEQVEEEFEFEINEDMLAFLEKSAKHKIELRKQREAEEKIEEDPQENGKATLKPQKPKESIQQQRDEMALLFGEAAPMVLSMETAMQLSFDRFNDKYHPKLWPNIPLNL